MLTIVRKVILDISVQKEIEFIQYQSAKNLEFACKLEVEFLHMRINLHFARHLKDTVLAVARKISIYKLYMVFYRMTDCAEELLPVVRAFTCSVFVCVNVENDIRTAAGC